MLPMQMGIPFCRLSRLPGKGGVDRLKLFAGLHLVCSRCLSKTKEVFPCRENTYLR